MDNPTIISLVILGAGLVLSLLRAAPLVFTLNLNIEVFAQYIEKLIVAGDLDRALKLCHAASTAVTSRATKGLLLAWTSGVRDSRELRDKADEAAGGVRRTVTRHRHLSVIAVLLVITGLGYAFARAGQPTKAAWVLAGVSALAILSAERLAHKIEVKTKWAIGLLVDVLYKHDAGGR